MKLSVPKGESPVSAGIVPGSQASGKVAICEVRTEVSQTAVSVSRWNRENYILRLLGLMRYHMLPKSKTLKRDCTEIVDVAGIDTRIPAGRRRVHLTERAEREENIPLDIFSDEPTCRALNCT
jgi:hypothetical protein